MDGDVHSYLSFLRQNVSELHQLGKEWGMTEAEISDCVERALQDEPKTPIKETNMSVARKIWHWIRVGLKWFFLSVALLLTLFTVLYVVSIFHVPTEMYITGFLQPYGYTIFRAVRLATLPFHDYFNITSMIILFIVTHLLKKIRSH